jgi:hypothetical protein
MLRTALERQIREPVIRLVFVLVMDQFVWQEQSPKLVFHLYAVKRVQPFVVPSGMRWICSTVTIPAAFADGYDSKGLKTHV